MLCKRIILFFAGLLFGCMVCSIVSAQNREEFISTRYNGPNAFPVPEMSDGRVSEVLSAELAGDGYFGYANDRTAGIFARLRIPLFTPRVNLSVWMPVCEWYGMTRQRQQECMLPTGTPINGYGFGDVYVSTDIQVLCSRRWWPDITVRAAMKTASGGQWELARHYDDPGYFFDIAVGKSLYLSTKGEPSTERKAESDWELRIAATTGFLCWQTRTARQDDAYQYGAQLFVRQQYVSARITWAGYSGWRKNGDRPMIVKAELRGYLHGFEPFASYQYGLRDYPFHAIRVGLAYTFDPFVKKKTKYVKVILNENSVTYR